MVGYDDKGPLALGEIISEADPNLDDDDTLTLPELAAIVALAGRSRGYEEALKRIADAEGEYQRLVISRETGGTEDWQLPFEIASAALRVTG
jgi:hypothetical protein